MLSFFFSVLGTGRTIPFDWHSSRTFWPFLWTDTWSRGLSELHLISHGQSPGAPQFGGDSDHSITASYSSPPSHSRWRRLKTGCSILRTQKKATLGCLPLCGHHLFPNYWVISSWGILIKTFLFGLALELHSKFLFLPHLHWTVIKKLFIELPSHFHRWAKVKGGHLQQHQSYRCGGNGCIPPQW